jgi:hypothetical protein
MKLLAFSLLSAYAAASPIEAVAAADVPTKVTIGSSTYSGNGCPQGSVSTILSDDRTVVTFGFDSFQAFIGPKSAQADKSKNCAIHINLNYPPGFQMSVMQATYHGYVRLDDGVSAQLYTSYFFSQAADKSATSRATLRGAEYKAGKVYEKKDQIENASVVWSPCGASGILNVNNRIALTSSRNEAEGEVSTDDATIKFTQKIAVVWRRCNNRRSRYVDEPEPESGLEPEFGLDGLNSTVTDLS